MQTYASPGRNLLRAYWSVSCVSFYVLPLPLFLHQVKYVQTSTPNASHLRYLLYSDSFPFPALSLNVRVNPFFAL